MITEKDRRRALEIIRSEDPPKFRKGSDEEGFAVERLALQLSKHRAEDTAPKQSTFVQNSGDNTPGDDAITS